MAELTYDRWGKSEVRVSKIHRGTDSDDFSDVTVQVLLEGEVEDAYLAGDNAGVLPTDTMRNTVYGLAQEHLTLDLEAFVGVLASHFIARSGIDTATVRAVENRWARVGGFGFVGGGSERRVAEVRADGEATDVWAGIEGLVVLKTRGSSFSGFPVDEFTILPEAEDRVLATSVSAEWGYDPVPADSTVAWQEARSAIIDNFFDEWSASVQHQGWLMARGALEAVPEMTEITFRLPNQHHLPFDLTRFGLEDRGVVFHPVSEPYGDIAFTATR